MVVGAVVSTLVQMTPPTLTGGAEIPLCSVVPREVSAEESVATAICGIGFNPLSTVVAVLGH